MHNEGTHGETHEGTHAHHEGMHHETHDGVTHHEVKHKKTHKKISHEEQGGTKPLKKYSSPTERLAFARLERDGRLTEELQKQYGDHPTLDKRARKIVAFGIPELQAAVEDGKIKLTAAYAISFLGRIEQKEALTNQLTKGKTLMIMSSTQVKTKVLNEERITHILHLVANIQKCCNKDFISKINTLESLKKLSDYCHSLQKKDS